MKYKKWTLDQKLEILSKLLLFEQHLYLRQLGYGTSYITGKYLLENEITEYGRKQELDNKPFVMKAFLDELNAIGSIPISLGQWEMTGTTMEHPK
jgi:hypothetical protein